jgi:hypothetical protein
MREHVQFEGRLRGDGKESTCSGWCTKVTLHGESDLAVDAAFADYRIDDGSVAPRRPDGSYELSTRGQTMRATRRDGRWLIG